MIRPNRETSFQPSNRSLGLSLRRILWASVASCALSISFTENAWSARSLLALNLPGNTNPIQQPIQVQVPQPVQMRPLAYYGKDFYLNIAQQGARQVREILNYVLRTYHNPVSGDYDSLSDKCTGAGCYIHTPVQYTEARRLLMGTLHLSQDASGYFVRDVYCQKNYGRADFKSVAPGPNALPDDAIINTEHTWPQSRFNRAFQPDIQKTDMHHLFPTDSKMNAIRGNKKFGEVPQSTTALPCQTAKFGPITGPVPDSDEHFEPPQVHKGNVARALFYFSVRYSIKIDADEEYYLRKWHKEDPVDAFEVQRNEAIFRLQGDRNPFIDHPELVDMIADF